MSRPRFTEADAVRLARAYFGVEAEARPLPSDRDQNFRLETAAGERFVLKLSNADEERGLVEAQHTVLRRLADAGLSVPGVVATRDGAELVAVEGADGRTHLLRMLTFVAGVPLAEVDPHTPSLRRDVGRLLGRLTAALDGFDHPAAHRTFAWDLAHAPATVFSFYHAITDPRKRKMVQGFLERFEAETAPRLDGLRRSVIHGDANDYNVLVSPPATPERRAAGLIDFGDLVHSFTAGEAAVAAAYAMLGQADPLGAAADVVAGFHEAFPLEEAEVDVLFPLICLRLCTSVVMSAHQRAREPENAYLSISERPAWALLERLADVHPRLAACRFRAACGLPPCSSSAAVADWLARNAGSIAPVVRPDPASGDVVVFDFSVGGADSLAPPGAPPLSAAGALAERLREAGAGFGVGRYDEARLVYQADQFRRSEGLADERRTIHLGLDLFGPAGTPVYAPLDGVVHSLADNDRPLDYGPTAILEHRPADAPVFYTLYGHLGRESLSALRPGQAVRAGERLGAFGAPEENGGWAPHLHLQVVADLLGREGDFPGVAPASEREVWLSLCPDPNLLTRIPADRFPPPPLAAEAIAARRRAHVGPSLSLSYRRPLHFVRGFMQHLYDAEGRSYLDGVNNVAHVGHGHPRVVETLARQAALLNTNTRYLHELLVSYAERLTATLPAPLSVCFFVNSGSEANDLALRLARAHTGRRDVVVLDGAYHGHLTSLIDVSPYKFDGPGGAGAPATTHVVPMPDPYRGPYRAGDPDAGPKYARHVSEAVFATPARIAAFLAEPLLSCGGQIVPPDGFLRTAYAHVRAAGGVCIADEVQVGFGRVGSAFWGFETQGVVPDIVTMGKPIGNGHPLGAVVTTPEIAASFAGGMEYFNTYGGNPVSCAVGLAVLDVIEDEGLQAHALDVGAHLADGLRGLQAEHPVVGDVRGRGLFVGVELVRDPEARTPAPEAAAYVVERMKDHRILLSTDGPDHNVLKIKPPLPFSRADADRLVGTLDDVLREDFVRG